MSNTKARKLAVVRKPNEAIRLEQGEAVHVGVDVHILYGQYVLDRAQVR